MRSPVAIAFFQLVEAGAGRPHRQAHRNRRCKGSVFQFLGSDIGPADVVGNRRLAKPWNASSLIFEREDDECGSARENPVGDRAGDGERWRSLRSTRSPVPPKMMKSKDRRDIWLGHGLSA